MNVKDAEKANELDEEANPESAVPSSVDGGSHDDEDGPSSGLKSAVQVITRYMCKYCGMQFIHRPDMDAHAVLHDDEKPPLTCGVCGKTYNTRSKLQRHVRVHSGERPFPCLICGKRFPRSDHVKQHMKVHLKVGYVPRKSADGLTVQKNYCRLCGVKFEHKNELQEHLLTHGFNKLFSCVGCGEVFDSSEQLKMHKTTHSHFDESLPVLSIPNPTANPSRSRKRKSGRGKSASSSGKRSKDKLHLGFAKFKLSRESGSSIWQTVGPVLKTEEVTTPEQSVSPADDTMPILEKIQNEAEHFEHRSADDHLDNEADGRNEEDTSDTPQMSISACYSLAEGQDNSDIPEIEEIRASTLTDGSNMIVIPTSSESIDETENNSTQSQTPMSDEDDGEDGEEATPADHGEQASTSGGTAGSKSNSSQTQGAQVRWIKPTSAAAPATTAAATLMTLQQEVHPQMASSATTAVANIIATTTTSASTRPTISLLPNVLTFRTHPVLATTAMQLHSNTANTSSISSNIYNSISSHNNRGLCSVESVPPGRKMMRCHYCCIWFEDSALGLLHQSLHSADETDPFTCKKCLKRLGNRLEFTAHIVWHLDPMMEDAGVI